MKKKITKDKDIEKQLAQSQEALKRALADYRNLERRTQEEKQGVVKFATSIFIMKFLPILDDLEKAAQFLNDSGLNIVLEKVTKILEEEGVAEIEAVNQKFDPHLMEAQEVIEGKDGQVLEVLRKGYSLDGRVLRPAQVKVGKKKVTETDKKAQKSSEFGDYA